MRVAVASGEVLVKSTQSSLVSVKTGSYAIITTKPANDGRNFDILPPVVSQLLPQEANDILLSVKNQKKGAGDRNTIPLVVPIIDNQKDAPLPLKQSSLSPSSTPTPSPTPEPTPAPLSTPTPEPEPLPPSPP